jgi:hypothetical protein
VEENSLGIAFAIIALNILSIIFFKIRDKKNKKNLAHYEAIADEHIRRMYDPVCEKIVEIIGLLIAGFYLSNVFFIPLYVIWYLLKNIQTRLTILQAEQDILMLKNGLINMFPHFNAYTDCHYLETKIEDVFEYLKGEKEVSQRYKNIFYKIKGKTVYWHQLQIEGMTTEEIKDLALLNKKRFGDYLRYIPKKVLYSNNKELIDNWLIYLDDVRLHF